MSATGLQGSALRDFVQRFREARGLGAGLDAAIEEAFRGAVCDRLTERMFTDKCPKMRRELLGRLLKVNRGTRHRWLDEPPGYERLLLGLLARRRLFDERAAGGEDEIIATATAAALAVISRNINGAAVSPPNPDAVRRLERLFRGPPVPPENGYSTTESRVAAWGIGPLNGDDSDREAVREWLIPWLIFHDATRSLWRLSDGS